MALAFQDYAIATAAASSSRPGRPLGSTDQRSANLNPATRHEIGNDARYEDFASL
jgi:hypothetical protein